MDAPTEPSGHKNIIGVILIMAGIAAALYHWVYQPSIAPKPAPAPVTKTKTTPAPAPATSNSTTPPPAGGPAPATQSFTSNLLVSIKGFSFVPENANVKVGTKITWTNFDTAGHTVTSNTGLFTSKILSQGKSFEYIFNKPGTYPYHCVLHPDMKGAIVVSQ